MKRGLTGEYRVATIGGEEVRAFIPYPLPPSPALDLTGSREAPKGSREARRHGSAGFSGCPAAPTKSGRTPEEVNLWFK